MSSARGILVDVCFERSSVTFAQEYRQSALRRYRRAYGNRVSVCCKINVRVGPMNGGTSLSTDAVDRHPPQLYGRTMFLESGDPNICVFKTIIVRGDDSGEVGERQIVWQDRRDAQLIAKDASDNMRVGSSMVRHKIS